jgi:NADPH:quinone reductase-like Zn-dependent oxidoreductase
MSSAEKNLPTTQSALQWVRVNDTNPFEWTTSATVINPSELGENQVLIENHATSLNPIDYKMAEKNFAKVNLPAVTGYDVSGRIVALGKNVKDFKVGDDAFGFLNFNSSNGGGAHQQYSVGEVDALVKKPASISHTDAATLGVAFLSAMVDYFHSSKDNYLFIYLYFIGWSSSG